MSRSRPRWQRVFRVRRRAFLLWLDSWFGASMEGIPSWGASLMLHAAALLLFALYLYSQHSPDKNVTELTIGNQLTEDLTSLVDSDHAGDPFTGIKTDEAPSMSLLPAPPDIQVTNQPEIPALANFTPDIAIAKDLAESAPPLTSKKSSKTRSKKKQDDWVASLGTVIPNGFVEDMSAPFSGRQSAEVRAKLVRREGGTKHSEAAVQAGLDWIVRHQKADGGWSLDTSSQCVGAGCPQPTAMQSDSAATGLALLPLLGAGHAPNGTTRYAANVDRGLKWLIAHQDPETGDLFSATSGNRLAWLYSHAIATMALCESYGLSGASDLELPAQAAINFIIEAQDPIGGGWRYSPQMTGDTSVFGWQMFAIRSARLAGLKIPRGTIKGCSVYLDLAAIDGTKSRYTYMAGRDPSYVMTAEALLARQYLGWHRDHPSLRKGVGQVASNLFDESGERNIYYWYYATQLLHNMHNEEDKESKENKYWENWNKQVRDSLVQMQVTENGCARGSWDPFQPQPDLWGQRAGRLFVTSLSILTLEVYYRYLPLYRPTDTDKPDPAAMARKPEDNAAEKDKEPPPTAETPTSEKAKAKGKTRAKPGT